MRVALHLLSSVFQVCNLHIEVIAQCHFFSPYANSVQHHIYIEISKRYLFFSFVGVKTDWLFCMSLPEFFFEPPAAIIDC